MVGRAEASVIGATLAVWLMMAGVANVRPCGGLSVTCATGITDDDWDVSEIRAVPD